MSTLALAGDEGAANSGDAWRWGASFAVVLGLHAAAVAVLLASRTLSIEPNDGPPVVLIDLAPPPAAPAEAPSETLPSELVPDVATPNPVMDAPPDIPPPEVEPPPQPIVAAEPPPPDPAPTVTPVEPPIEKPPVLQQKAEVALPPPPKPAPKPAPKPKPVERKPPKPVKAERAERREAEKPPAQASGAPATASTASTANGSTAAASRSSWQSQLVAYLQRNLRYPPGSRGGGVTAVAFAMNRSGSVLSSRVARSSGAPDLDEAALDLFHRGGLPPPPSDVPGQSFSFTIPIRFNAR